MSKDSHLIVSTWKKIAEYTPFTEQALRKRFGKEMKALGIIYKGNMPGNKRPEPIIWGIVWRIEKYFDMMGERGELGLHNSTRTKQARTKRLDKLLDRMDDVFEQGKFDPNKIKRVVNLS